MKRYTEKHFGRADYYMVCSCECSREDLNCIDCPVFEQLVDRLGAYEDTGLEPEQFADMVPVVRCKDCRFSAAPKCQRDYCEEKGILKCHNPGRIAYNRRVYATDFCSYGEKETND